LNPNAARTGDANPSGQAPHITSAYIEAVGKELGLRGVAAARSDNNRPRYINRQSVLDAFRQAFDVKEVADAIMGDVNQQGEDAQRVINRERLAKWAAEAARARGGTFNPYIIYFDEDKAVEYEGQPKPGSEYQPFLSRKTAMQVMLNLFEIKQEVKQAVKQEVKREVKQEVKQEISQRQARETCCYQVCVRRSRQPAPTRS